MNPTEPPKGIQTLIHFLEEGAGKVWARRALVLILLVLAVVLYQMNEARNFKSPEAMDAAQLGRNLAAGNGYTTSFIRPLSLHLLQKQAALQGRNPQEVLTHPHPDLENPPVYPLLLAGVFKAMPASWWTRLPANQGYHRPWEEVVISGVNLLLLGGVLGLVWLLGSRLFDPGVGWVAAALACGTESFWQFANSGLPVVLLMVLALALMHLVVSFEQECSRTEPRPRQKLLLAATMGFLVGLMFMTRYSFGILILPVGAYLVWRSPVGRFRLVLMAIVVTLGVSAPWLGRNWHLSGSPLGTAGFALLSGTESFPGDRLERSQHPQLDRGLVADVVQKWVENTQTIVRDEVIHTGGTWLSAFFLLGLIVPFNQTSLNRLRIFLLACLLVLITAQAGGRTWLSTVSGPFTGENLLVVLTPIFIVFGTGFLMVLLEQVEWPGPVIRSLATWSLVAVLSTSFLLAIMPPRQIALQDPPYRPAVIREFAEYSPKGTLFMSDIPWAMAWYGPRECVWATLRVVDSPEANVRNQREDFFVFTEARRPVQAVYISPYWADQPMRQRFLGDPDFAWGRFYLDVLTQGSLPSGFPLKHVLGGPYMKAGHFLLASRDWWSQGH